MNTEPERPSKGTQTQNVIIEAAIKTLIAEGYSGFTLRKVAAEAALSIGNLNYHYRTKSALIEALLDFITDRIIAGFAKVAEQAGQSPELKLRAVLEYWIDDLKTVETSVFFPEIWSLANHHEFAQHTVNRSYSHALEILIPHIRAVNPDLSAHKIDELAKFMCASMEGLTVFVGHEKMWFHDHETLKRTAIETFIALIKERK